MLKVKANYKNGYPDLRCRMCKIHVETQKHILEECLAMHSDENLKVTAHQLFNDNGMNTLREVASKLESIQKKLDDPM